MAEIDFTAARHAWQLKFEGAWPMAVAFIGPRLLAAGNREGAIFLWELPAGLPEAGEQAKPGDLPPLRLLRGHTNGVTRLTAAADGRTLVSASLDHTVRIWDTSLAAAGKEESVLDVESRRAEAKKQRSDDPLGAPGIMVEVQTDCETLPGHADWVNGLDLAAEGGRLISGDAGGVAIVWDFPNRREVARWRGHPGNWVTSAALSPDGETAFVAEYCSKRGDFDRPPAQARIYDAGSGDERIDLLEVQFPNVKVRDNSYGYATTWVKFVAQGFVCAKFSPDGKLLAVGQGGETGKAQVHLIESDTGKLIRSVAEHQYGVCDCLFTPDGKHLISSGRDTTVQICEVESGKEVARLHEPRGGQFKDWLSAVALAPDGRLLAAADISGCVQVWQLQT